MNNSQNNLFFYRDKDPVSIQIYTLLKSNNLLNYFKLIDVDKTRVPANIQRVPALLVPQIKKILYDNEIFNFIQTITINKRSTMNQQNNYIEDYQNNRIINMNKYKQTIQQNQNIQNVNNTNNSIDKSNIQQFVQSSVQTNYNQNTNQKNILGFIEGEMSGFSDNYTFSDSNINIAPQHNFVKSDDVIKIFTVNDNTKLNARETKDKIMKLTEERNKENELFKSKNLESRNNKMYNEQIKKINEKLNEMVRKKEQQM